MILLSRVASYGNTSALQKRGLKSRGKLCPAVIKDRKYGLEAPIFDTKNSTEERKWGRSEENYPVQPKSRKKMPLVGAPVKSFISKINTIDKLFYGACSSSQRVNKIYCI